MKKLKIEELSVESFVVSPVAVGGPGTVRGFRDTWAERTVCEWTCLVDQCQPSDAVDCTTGTVVFITVDGPGCVATIEDHTCVVDICQPTFAYSCIDTDCGARC